MRWCSSPLRQGRQWRSLISLVKRLSSFLWADFLKTIPLAERLAWGPPVCAERRVRVRARCVRVQAGQDAALAVAERRAAA